VTSYTVLIHSFIWIHIFAGKYNEKCIRTMEIVSIEKKTFEEMKERFGCFSRHVKELCARYRPPGKMNWMDGADVCEKLGISKRTLQTYRDRGLLPYSQINHKIYYQTEDVEVFVESMSREIMEDE
jgi:hypothetical protein